MQTTTGPLFRPVAASVMGATPAGLGGLAADAALFGAPHGTPYPSIDNRVHAGSAQAIRDAQVLEAAWVDHWDFDFDGTLLGDGLRLADLGDLATAPDDGPGNRAAIRDATAAILAAGATPLMIGGDDSTPIPFIEGFAVHGPLTILQIDAHIDWRDEREGEPMGFSSTMRRASEMAHVERIVQVGARGFGSARASEVADARAWGATLIPARTLHAEGVAAALAHVPDGARVLIALDCDALDPSVLPAVAAPTPGGLSYTQAIELIAGAGAKAEIVGFDLVEFTPGRDADGLSSLTAARLVANVVGALAKGLTRSRRSARR